jgi:hypothetical protein
MKTTHEHESFELHDPSNHLMCAFDVRADSERCRDALLRAGCAADDVHLWQGSDLADDVDVSAKWFADTDKLLKEYQRLLREGKSVLTLTAPDSEHRDEITAILRQHNAQLITYFGKWVMETI